MAGHSKWKNIMYRKGAQDAKRAKRFTKLVREVVVAARSGMPDPSQNPRLRSAIAAARAQNVPKDNIERALKKISGADETYDEMRYEGFGPGGVALIVDALTDNRNRTASEVRSIFGKHGGTLGESGSVTYMFQRVGVMRYPSEAASADEMFETALEIGASDCTFDADGHEVVCEPERFHEVREALEARLGPPEEAELTWKPLSSVAVSSDQAEPLFRLIEALDDNDDVQQVSANYEVSEDFLQRMTA
jgi:YebC/PmpR family DNA-binding regulatory protein